MANFLSAGTMFPESVATEMFNKVRGKSSIAAMSAQTPIPFTGTDVFTFALDKDVDLVGEATLVESTVTGAKGVGGATVAPVKIVPVKIEYGARVSDEFMYSSEEKQLDILKAFAEGFARKVAKGFDMMVMHGINPRTKTAAASLAGKSLDAVIASDVAYATDADTTVEAAISALGATEYDATGIVVSPAFRSQLAGQKANGQKLYPELGWGAAPGQLNGMKFESNSTVSTVKTAGSKDIYAYGGDFENAFKWGYAKNIPLEVIPYGDPDNSGYDLKGHNQVYLRGEAYIGWGILDGNAFFRIHA